jgi:hypothetical protein
MFSILIISTKKRGSLPIEQMHWAQAKESSITPRFSAQKKGRLFTSLQFANCLFLLQLIMAHL